MRLLPTFRTISVLAPALAASLLSAGAHGQFHARLLDHVPPSGFHRQGDVQSNGTTAVLGQRNEGVEFFDVSDPSDLQVVSTWTLPGGSSQDVKIYGDLAFVASETSPVVSVQILDLRNPAAPVLLTDIVNPDFNRVHNIFFHEGWLYLAHFFFDPFLELIDLRGYDIDNPPTTITGYDYRMTIQAHDMVVQDDIMVLCAWNYLRVFDVSDLDNGPPLLLHSEDGYNTHSASFTEDSTYLAVADEFQGGGIRLFEVLRGATGFDLVQRDSHVLPVSEAYSAHNPIIVGNRVYTAHLAGGAQVLEIDRTDHSLEVVASYPTRAPTSSYLGAWGIDPLQGADRVLVSDMDTGIFSIDFSGIEIDFPAGRSPVLAADQPHEVVVELKAIGNRTFDPLQVSLHWRIEGGVEQSAAMVDLGGGHFSADLPGIPCGSRVEYWVCGADTLGELYFDPADAPLHTHAAYTAGGLLDVFFDDFSTNQGWTVVNDPGLIWGSWERNWPLSSGAQPEGGAPGGTPFCFVTGRLSGSSATVHDVDGGPTILTSPALDFSAGDGLLRWWEWFSSNKDEGYLELEISGDDGATWVPVSSTERRSGGWRERFLRVSDYVIPGPAVRVRWFAGDDGDSLTEALIDEFRASVFGCFPANSSIRSGTGVNPLVYQTVTEPILGQNWQTTVDLGATGALASIVSVGLGGPAPPGIVLNGFLQGELLILAPFPPHDVALGNHTLSLPLELSLVGSTIATQASGFVPGSIQLYNAIDGVLGF